MAVQKSAISLLFWFVLLSAGLASPFFAGPFFSGRERERKEIPALGDAPRIVLTDSSGARFDSARLSGKLWVVNFFFSSCQGICPAMNGRIAALFKLYMTTPDVEFVSITVDPETDTPDVLSEYSKRFQADTSRWHFLTGPIEHIKEILDGGFRLVTSDDRNLHTTRVVLVDREGKIRGYYQGTEDDLLAKVSADIDALR